MNLRIARLALLAIPIIAARSEAQKDLKVNLEQKGGKTVIDATSPIGDITREQSFKEAEPLTVVLTCKDPVNCKKVKVQMVSKERSDGFVPATPTLMDRSARWEFTPDLIAGNKNLMLRISDGGQPVAEIALSATSAQGGVAAEASATGPGDGPESLAALVAYDCSAQLNVLRSRIGDDTYFKRHNVARFVIAANGNVWSRPGVNLIDEDDKVEILLVAHPALLPTLKLRRSSAFRAPGVFSIVGGDIALQDLISKKSLRRDIAPLPACDVYSLVLSDFQPGRGEVTISALTNKGDVSTGSFEFGVNTLYRGAFALGAIRSRLRDPRFGLVAKGADSLITEIEDRTPRTLYTLTYTPFVWGRRDVEKDEPLLDHRRFNPIFGIVLSDVANNFVGGVTYDLGSAVYLSFGAHTGRVRKLNSDAGLKSGDIFKGTSAQIPTTRDWRTESFVGVSLDLRAAAQFVKKAVATPAS